jgi:HK97 family phage prohead protease
MKKNQETRRAKVKLEVRTDGDEESQVIEGYALKFNRASEVLGWFRKFREKIDPHALDEASMDNVVATFNHDQNQILGRTGVNLDLSVDNIGLKFRLKPVDTTLTRDMLENIKAGIINQCSFAFTIPDSDDAEDWEESEEDGVDYDRTIRKIDHLYDVSVVTTPAYPDTEVTVGERSKERVERLNQAPIDLEKRKLLNELTKNELLKGI